MHVLGDRHCLQVGKEPRRFLLLERAGDRQLTDTAKSQQVYTACPTQPCTDTRTPEPSPPLLAWPRQGATGQEGTGAWLCFSILKATGPLSEEMARWRVKKSVILA